MPDGSTMTAARAGLEAFSTANNYNGGCSDCGCVVPLVHVYDTGDPVPEADFSVYFGYELGPDDEPRPVSEKRAVVSGQLDANGRAMINDALCGSYMVIFGEGSDESTATVGDKGKPELGALIDQYAASSGVALTPEAKGELLAWIVSWTYFAETKDFLRETHEAAERASRTGSTADDDAVRATVSEHLGAYGQFLWTDENGEIDEEARTRTMDQVNGWSDVGDLFEGNGLNSDGPIYALEEKLKDVYRSRGVWPDDPLAMTVARRIVDDTREDADLRDGYVWDTLDMGKPNDAFQTLLAASKMAQDAVAQLLKDATSDDPGTLRLVAEIVLGCVPIIGDIVDVVDIVKWIKESCDEPGLLGEVMHWVELGCLSLGFIPGVGNLLKAIFKPIAKMFKTLARTGGALTRRGAEQIAQEIRSVTRSGSMIKLIGENIGKLSDKLDAVADVLGLVARGLIRGLTKLKGWIGLFVGRLVDPIIDVATRLKDEVVGWINKAKAKINEFAAKFQNKLGDARGGGSRTKGDTTPDVHDKASAKPGRDGDAPDGETPNGTKPPDCPIGLPPPQAAAQGAGTLVGNPVDVARGKVFVDRTDVALRAVLDVSLRRTWLPGHRGLFGANWADELSATLTYDGPEVVYTTPMGRAVHFNGKPEPGAVYSNLHVDDYRLIDAEGELAIRTADGRTLIYAATDGTRRHLSEVRDDNGNFWRVEWDFDPSMALRLIPVRIRLSNGLVLDIRTEDSRIRTITLRAEGATHRLVDYGYDDRGDLVTARDAAGAVERYGYDPRGRLDRIDYPGGHHTRYRYDDEDRVLAAETDTPYHGDRFEYRDPGEDGLRDVIHTDALGHRSRYVVDASGRLRIKEDALGQRIALDYDGNGDLAALTDPLGHRTAYAYDALGNIVRETRPDGTETLSERDAWGRLLAYTDPAGATWRYDRDGRGNVTAEHWPDGRSWLYVLNGRGQPERIVNPDGTALALDYDDRHRLSAWTDALGATTAFAYDAFGRLAMRTEPDGTASRFTYDRGGRLTSATLADGRVLSWAWSARGDLLSATDGEGRAVTRDYGPYGLLERITDPRGGTIRFERDPLMRLTGVVNELGERYAYEYDAAGRVTAEVDFSGRRLAYAYDAAGRLTGKTAGDGVRTALSYDRMDRLTRAEIFEGGPGSPPALTRYAYDPRGLMIEAQNRDAAVTLERDVLGRVTRETVNGRTVESAYDASGALAARDFDGRLARYAYDANGLMSALAIGGHAPLDFERDVMGRERMRRSAAGFAEARRWDRLGQLSAQAAGRADGRFLGPQLADRDYWDAPEAARGGAGVARQYDYDRAFNPVAIMDARWGATRYDYDANDQVTRASYEHAPGAGLIEERFTYDAARNIAAETETVRGASLSLSNAEAERVARADYTRAPGGRIERRGDTTYAYDAQGRMISKRVEKNGFRPQKWRYEWDGEDQLRRVHAPDGAVWEYAYDPFGRRIGKACVRGSAAKRPRAVAYLWAGNLLSEERRVYADGSEQTVGYHYEQGSFRPIAQEVDGVLTYIVTDHLGTPKELLDEEGAVVWSAKHELWGGIRAMQHFHAANDNAGYQDCLLRFQGQIEDAETGLYYNRFRYYDPTSGNYASSDPIGLEGGIRANSYVESPVYWLDIFGLARCPDVTRDGLGRPTSWSTTIDPSDLGTGTATSAATRAHARSLGNSTDDAGHALASRLGGSGTNPNNIFPQSPNINRGRFRVFEKEVAEAIQTSGKPAKFELIPSYTGNSTRPSSLTYNVTLGDGSVLNRTFPNP